VTRVTPDSVIFSARPREELTKRRVTRVTPPSVKANPENDLIRFALGADED